MAAVGYIPARGHIANEVGTAVRITRSRIIRLKNDYKHLMEKIEHEVHAYFANIRENEQPAPDSTPSRDEAVAQDSPQQTLATNGASIPDRDAEALPPFARINSIAENGPAFVAGLKVNDLVCSFGDVNWLNHSNLTRLSSVVQQNQEVSLSPNKISSPGHERPFADMCLSCFTVPRDQ